MALSRNAAQACRVFQPVVESEGKSGPKMVIGFLPSAGWRLFLFMK
jgi:hypothetical protein